MRFLWAERQRLLWLLLKLREQLRLKRLAVPVDAKEPHPDPLADEENVTDHRLQFRSRRPWTPPEKLSKYTFVFGSTTPMASGNVVAPGAYAVR